MKNFQKLLFNVVFFVLLLWSSTGVIYAYEVLDRGFIVMPIDSTSVYMGWRMFIDDNRSVAFDVFRQVENDHSFKLNAAPIIQTSDFVDKAVDFTKNNTWYLKNSEGKIIASYRIKANAALSPYLSVPIQKPEGGVVEGESFDYTANDASVGDLDGDGEYEIILKWEPTNSKRPPQKGFTGNTYIDAYKLNGKRLWRIDLGKNIRSGAAYTQFLVYDFDGDGKSEMICKTGNGTIDGLGNIIGDGNADWRTMDKDSPTYGKIVDGIEYLTVFDGKTGRNLSTVEYIPTRYPLNSWGGIGGNGGNDSTGGRSDRFSACVAHLGGDSPSAVMVRGWYGRTVLAAWDFKDGKLQSRWVFDSSDPQWEGYSGMGNHSVTVADFDGDGFDEVCVGAMTVDHDGQGLFTTGLRHGDALHAGNLIPSRQGLEVYGVHESEGRTLNLNTPGIALFDGNSGEIIWSHYPGVDVGRGLAADIDPRYDGAECWGGPGGLRRSDTGKEIYDKVPNSCNFAIWWDADPLRELLDKTTVSKWNWLEQKTETLFRAEGVVSNNWTKANPCLQADLFGDWREEIIWRTPDNSELRIYSTTIPSIYRMPTLMHNHQYRMAIAWQNVAYNQPPHPDFDMMEESKKWLLSQSGFTNELFNIFWTVESPDYKLKLFSDTLEISAPKGFTLWRNEKYTGDLEISYKACVMDEGLKGDRLSDLNCFWMAGDPLHPDDIHRRAEWRNGVFGRYYSLNMYYLGYGGNSNTTTRFRKYNGDFDSFEANKVRPDVITEYTDEDHLLKPNHWYDIKIVCKGRYIKYYINGELIVDFQDDSPYTSGWFGFRTTQSRIRLTDFKVY
nr:DUF6250 domain-containing protein [Dysgonomonas sp. 216]